MINSTTGTGEKIWPPMHADSRRSDFFVGIFENFGDCGHFSCVERAQLDELTERIIGAVFSVSNSLGGGFLEKVYEKALLREFSLLGIRAEPQVVFSISYKGFSVGEYFADLLVERAVLVELKCVDRFTPEHSAQCMNYLKASGLKVCLLVNFQRAKVEWKRIVVGF